MERQGIKRYAKTCAGSARCRALLCLCVFTPLQVGGCTVFRDDLVGVLATATRSALFGNDDIYAIADTARASLIDSALDFFFNQLEADGGGRS